MDRRWLLPVALTSLLLIIVIALLYVSGSEPVTAEIKGKLLLAIDGQGNPLWSKTFPEAADSYREPLIVADVDSDGHNEVLFNYNPRPPEQPGQSKLICFDRTGRVRWEFVYGRAKRWRDRELSPLYFGSSIHLVRSAGDIWVMTVAKQNPFFPCQVAFLDPSDGTPVWEYWHPGHLSGTLLADLDGDRSDEILLSGINNPGPGIGYAALVALEFPKRGKLPAAPEQWMAADKWGGDEFRYLLFPRSAVSELIGGGASANDLFMPAPGEIGVGLSGGLEEQRHICWSGVYKLDFNFNVIEFRPHDCFPSTVDLFVKQGKLPPETTEEEFASLLNVLHLKTAPDANSPEVAQLWNSMIPTSGRKVHFSGIMGNK